MRQKHRHLLLVLNIIAIVLILCFVFSNSMASKKESSQQSTAVSNLIRPILYPVVDLLSAQPVTNQLLHTVVRKTAHFVEFAALAVFSTLLLYQLRGTWRTHCLAYVLFGTLLSAVTDEFIQSLTERGSRVTDVVLDFSGALTGILLTVLLAEWIRHLLRNKP